MRLYLYGPRVPELAELIESAAIQEWIRPLFSSPSAGLPEAARTAEGGALFERAARSGLLAADGEVYRAGPRLAPIPASATEDLAERTAKALGRYMEIAADAAAALRAAYAQTSPSRRHPWAAVSHAVVAGMFLDLAMGRELIVGDRIERRQSESAVWAFERLDRPGGAAGRDSLGVQIFAADPPDAPAERRIFLAQLWHARIQRKLRLGPHHVEALSRLTAEGALEGAGKELVAYLKIFGLVRKAAQAPRLEVMVPVFAAADAARLLPVLHGHARRLVEEGIDPALEAIGGHPWWSERFADEAYRHAAVRLVLEHGVASALRGGALEPFPQAAGLPKSWGRWLWTEPGGELRLLAPTNLENPPTEKEAR